MSLTDNMLLRSFRDGKSIFADRKASRELAEKVVDELEIDTPGVDTPVRRLLGGNVQKVLVGREIPPPQASYSAPMPYAAST